MSGHPQNEDVAAYIEGGLPPAERASLEAHLAACAECRQLATEAAHLLRSETRRRRWLAAAPVAGIAAAAALALFVILPAGDEGPPAPDTMRAGPEGGAEALLRIEAVSPDTASIPHPDSLRFVWHSAAPEALYRLDLTDSAGGAVWEATTADTTVRPPPDVRLEPGRQYFWYVDALLPDGTEATSGARGFRTRGP